MDTKAFFFHREVDFGLHALEFLSSVVWEVVIVFWFLFCPNTFRDKKQAKAPQPYREREQKKNRKCHQQKKKGS